MTKKERYRSDEEYRRKRIETVKLYNANLDPLGKQIQYCHKKLHSLRESIKYHYSMIDKLDKRIFWWLDKRRKLHERRKQWKASANGV